MNQTTVKETETAWLAGIVDGEGCIAFLRRTDYVSRDGTNRLLEVRCDVKIAMADEDTINFVGQLIAEIVGEDNVRVFCEQRKIARTRPLWRVEVNSKGGTQTLLKALLPYLVTKRIEALLVLDYLSRSVDSKKYKATDRDRLLAHLATGLRHGSGEARAEALIVLSQVIPSQAEGIVLRTSEGVETRSVRNETNTPTQERPATTKIVVEEIVPSSDENRSLDPNSRGRA